MIKKEASQRKVMHHREKKRGGRKEKKEERSSFFTEEKRHEKGRKVKDIFLWQELFPCFLFEKQVPRGCIRCDYSIVTHCIIDFDDIEDILPLLWLDSPAKQQQ